jgi:CspA family cold shock protein
VVEKVKTRGTAVTAEGTAVKNPGTDPPAEDPAKGAISVFDCWQREWVPSTTTSFLTKCAGIVKIQGTEAFERANVSFIIAYCDGTTETFAIPFSYDGKRTKGVKKRDRITGTVVWFNPDKGYGFIRPSSGERDVFVHISAVEEAGLDTLDEGDTVEYELVTAYDGRTSADNLTV